MSQIESTTWTQYTPLYENKQFENRISQWRLTTVYNQKLHFSISTSFSVHAAPESWSKTQQLKTRNVNKTLSKI